MAPPLELLLLGALLVPSAARAPTANASAVPTVQVTVGVLVPERNAGYPWAWLRVAPALSLALEALEAQLRQAGISIRTAFGSTENEKGKCDSGKALAKATELMLTHDPDVVLGLGCPQTSSGVADFFQPWQRPLLVTGDYQTRDFSSMVNAGPLSPWDFVAFQARLLRHFNWTARAVVVVGRWIPYWNHFPSLNSAPRRAGPADFATRAYFNTSFHEYQEPGEAVRFIQAEGRVVYLCGSLKMVHEIMLLAQAQNMTNGDYVFFFLDPFGESLRAAGHHEAAKPWQSYKTQDTGGLREAFQIVLVITSHEPQTPAYRQFQSQLILRAQKDFGVALSDSVENVVAGCFHDGLLLYLKALIETLHEGGTKQDTSHILEKMRGLKFQGVTGRVSINSQNDRETDLDLWAMRDVESGEYQVVAHYIATEERINWTGPILWKTGRPPLDNPPCTFNMDDPSCGKSGCVIFCYLVVNTEPQTNFH